MSTASKDAAGWLVNYTIAGTGEKTISFKTENKFIDADARVVVSTPAASNPTLDLTNNSTTLTMGTANNGVYSPIATLTGNASIANAGWIAADDYTVSDTDVVVGKVNQSTMLNGSSPVANGSTIVPGPSNQTITISEGYNTARTLTIGSTSASSPGVVTSGSVTFTEADTISISHTTGDNYFEVTGTKDISAPIVNTAGYVSGSIGTLNANTNGATLDIKMPIGEIIYDIESNRLVQPEIEKQAISITGVTDAANGAATSTAPNSGVYVAVQAPNITKNITVTASVGTEGYIRNGVIQYANSGTFSVGTVDSEVFYVPIKTTSAQVDGRNVTYDSGWITAGTTSIPAGTVTSGTASITSTTIAYNSTNSNFDITGSADISAPTINTEGYVSNSIGTKSANTEGATLTSTLPKIAIQANLSGTGTKTPSITKNSNTNIAQAGTATTTKPSSGYYIAVSSAANTDTVQATATVATAGYGTTTSGQYTTTPSSSLIVGAAASAVTYIPITATTFANSRASGVTYNDISSTAPILVSGDYLYINAGYTPNVKISLAQLVPDATGDNAPANYILSGYTAFDNNGALIVGTMQTYDGTYTIT